MTTVSPLRTATAALAARAWRWQWEVQAGVAGRRWR